MIIVNFREDQQDCDQIFLCIGQSLDQFVVKQVDLTKVVNTIGVSHLRVPLDGGDWTGRVGRVKVEFAEVAHRLVL